MPTMLNADPATACPPRPTARTFVERHLGSRHPAGSRRPVATALTASVEAVSDALAHLDEGAILAVPIGEPIENFNIVEWCATNGKLVINRFDPWPLEHLLVENTPSS